MVPGEGEILGQVKDAYEGGSPGPLLDRLFRSALHAGRRARVETSIGESPASVPAAAAALAQQVFGDLGGRAAVIVGAGKMSELTARNLRSRGAEITVVANRSEARGSELAGRLGARAIDLEQVGGSLADADVVVASTSAPGFVFGAAEAGAALRSRRGRPILLLDLAVPRDVDPALASIDGCFLYDIDDLEAVVETSLSGRRAEAVRAERIVAEEAERFRERQAALAVVPAIASLRARAEAIRMAELARAESRLGRLAESDRRLVEAMTAQIVGKLLHLPTVRMKEAAVSADGVVYAEVVRHLFGLGRRSRRDATGFRRPSASAAGTHCVRPHPQLAATLLWRVTHRDEALLCCFASAPAEVGSRSPRRSAPRLGCVRPGWRSRWSRSRPQATVTAAARSARSAPAACS
jgi:glutamyl-tRNA reductase